MTVVRPSEDLVQLRGLEPTIARRWASTTGPAREQALGVLRSVRRLIAGQGAGEDRVAVDALARRLMAPDELNLHCPAHPDERLLTTETSPRCWRCNSAALVAGAPRRSA